MKSGKFELPIMSLAVLSLAMMVISSISHAAELFDETKVIIEINATDGDAGFHVLFDAGAWKQVRIDDPAGKKLFDEKAFANLREQGLTENFFESAEPVCHESLLEPEDEDDPVVPLADFLERFPKGLYEFFGKSNEQEKLFDTAMLTHVLPAAPDLGDEEVVIAFEFDPDSPADTPVVIEWEPGDDLGECDDPELVPGIIPDPETVEVVAWEVVVEPADDEVLEPSRVFSVQLSGEQAESVTVPPEYLASLFDEISEDTGEDVVWVKFEVGAIETSGNQTFSEREFCLWHTDDAIEEDCDANGD